MKNKILIVSALIVLCLTTVVLANTLIEDITVDESEKIVIRSAETFDSISECSRIAQYYNVCAYVAFMGENNFSPEQLTVINRILDKGTTVQSLAQVYDFWLTTDEPFSIVEEICALEDKYFSEYWFENAFNKLTDNRHGVLDKDAIGEYKDKGISVDEILAANTLCRKGVYTITEILDKVALGESIDDIACEIYGLDTLPEADSSFGRVKLALKAMKYGLSSSSSGTTAKANTSAIEAAQTAYTDVISSKIKSEINRLSLSTPTEADEDIEAMQSTGLPIGTLRALQNKGFTPAEISKIPEMDTDDIFAAAKMAREVLKNE